MARIFLLYTLVIALAGCSSSDNPHRNLFATIEASVKLPAEAFPLSSYSRYYANAEDGSISAAYVVHSEGWLESTAQACREFEGDEKPHPCPVGGGSLRLVKPGNSLWVRDEINLPTMAGGGCNLVTFKYHVDREKFSQMECNGPY
ncbi:MAG TPA: hypothetical protein PKD99_05560 [Sphingopyxis sp.]|nr:hypothetical protein [Sphingopyxis sp.]HMP44554.1 hypothetical protein [Sphingopyxis sp.]HMQ18392.1 hypothetical protein [Sphingopyxis sp.]